MWVHSTPDPLMHLSQLHVGPLYTHALEAHSRTPPRHPYHHSRTPPRDAPTALSRRPYNHEQRVARRESGDRMDEEVSQYIYKYIYIYLFIN